MKRLRIAVAGFQHETNTFVPTRAGFEEFQMADSWPGMLRGESVISGTQGMNLPIAGAISAALETGRVDLKPLLWCSAEPTGPVTDDVFDRISGMILEGLAPTAPVDGIYLDLHGAMVTETHEDGEGALLARIREQVGPNMPIGVSLDLHANVSADMVERADIITIYRTYPHLDMAQTGGRCLNELLRHIDGKRRCTAFRQAPFLVPAHTQFTGQDPCRKLYGLLDELPSAHDEFVELAMGFPAADISDCGPSVVAYADTDQQAAELSDRVMSELCASEFDFDAPLLEPRDAVWRAMEADGTVVIADVQDNPGAGGTSDTTGLLAALVDLGAKNVLLGVMCDPDAADTAHRIGAGSTFTCRLGGKSGLTGQHPFEAKFKVIALSDGCIKYSGEMYSGGIAKMGPSCLLSLVGTPSDVRIVVSSTRIQCLDRAMFLHFGVDPALAKIVCVKSTVHFRADFEPISREIFNAAAPGAFPCRLDRIKFKNVKRAVPVARLR